MDDARQPPEIAATRDPDDAGPQTTLPIIGLHPLQCVGRYHILEALAEGGMGAVFKAEQRTPVRRVVALKLVKPGMDSREVLARFESERQALARMDHPNIARVLDAGADDFGRPYFVMEYVPGIPITRFCDENRLSVVQRLELFLQVCGAVQHAHQKMIVHRDLKASNVLAYLHDGDRATTKVIDFGIAKALTPDRLTDRTFNTNRGEAVGTYETMSPEQAAGSPDIDTRTDVYSLGALLYELLTGAKPFDSSAFAQAPDAEVRRMIREVDPPRPSTRLTNLGLAAAAMVAQARQAKLEVLAKQLRRELEWIPLKAMRKERERRYASPLQLADDVRNYLAGRPLFAAPESQTYRLRKFLRKHVRGVAVTTGVIVLLLGLVVALSVLVQRAHQARVQEAGQRSEAERQKGLAEAAARRLAIERDRAVTAERISHEERRRAELLLADALTGQGNGLSAAGAVVAGWESYGKASEQFSRLGMSPLPADLGLLKSYALHPPPVMVLEGHPDGVLSAALSGDGRRALAGGKDGTLKWWDVPTGRALQVCRGHVGWVIGVALSPDGTRALTAGDDKSVRLWDLSTGRELRRLDGHEAPVRVVAFHPDGTRAVSAGEDGTVRIWDLSAGIGLLTLRGNRGPIRSIAVSPNGTSVIAGSSTPGKTPLVMWDFASGAET